MAIFTYEGNKKYIMMVEVEVTIKFTIILQNGVQTQSQERITVQALRQIRVRRWRCVASTSAHYTSSCNQQIAAFIELDRRWNLAEKPLEWRLASQ